MVWITARSSVGVAAAAAFGRNSARAASQSTPLKDLSKWVSRTIVQTASNVSRPLGTSAVTAADAQAIATAATIARPFT